MKGPELNSRFLLIVAGAGGLLYGIDVGIIGAALPYLEATSGLTAAQLSFVVASVLLGSVVSTLFAGALADLVGRRPLMIAAGVLFSASVPVIAMSGGYFSLILGRLLQGISGGLIGVVVPLYLAECLDPSQRGTGTGIFQWLLTFGVVVAAGIGIWFSVSMARVAATGAHAEILAFQDRAWRGIFWASLPPGIFFAIGSAFVAESPRWLFQRGKTEAARAALLWSRSAEQAGGEFEEMHQTVGKRLALRAEREGWRSLMQRRYVAPFVLACLILAFTQTTGINSIIGFSTVIFVRSGLTDVQAHAAYLGLTLINFAVTIAAVLLVDRKGRKFLLTLGTAGMVVCLAAAGAAFVRIERAGVNCRDAVQKLVHGNTLDFSIESLAAASPAVARCLTGTTGRASGASISVIYSFGGFRAVAQTTGSTRGGGTLLATRADCVPQNWVLARLKSPFANWEQARVADMHIDDATVSPTPSERDGVMVAISLFGFMAFFAIGPGVCVWLALSELMPTRIRSNGMSIALVINQAVSATIAAGFLPVVGLYGYSFVFFCFAGFTVIYLAAVAIFLPETKGRTLEEIDGLMAGAAPAAPRGNAALPED